MNLVSLQFKTKPNFNDNLNHLVSLINRSAQSSFILAPELCLTGYSYDDFDKAIKISTHAITILTELSSNKTIFITLLTQKDNKYFNTLHIFHHNKIIHTQSKYKLFSLGNEDKYFTPGNRDDIKILNINGLKIAILICFELRFVELWSKIKGADIIFIPAMWGKSRKEHFQTLSKALAIANQCFVVTSNSANDDMAKSSSIVSPFGVVYTDSRKLLLNKIINLDEIKKMRRYLPIHT